MPKLKTTLADGRVVQVAVRRHPRYRHVRLRVNADGAVHMSAPAFVSHAFLREFLDGRRSWLAGHLPREAPALQLPERLELRAVHENWRVVQEPAVKGLLCRPALKELAVAGADVSRDLTLLRGWLKEYAREHLGGTLAELAESTGLHYRSLSVRGQKTRWGSYSSRGTVSLNWKLLFLPEELMRYVLIHELCHSRHLNHSPAYWREVARHVSDVPGLRVRMRSAGSFVPAWTYREGGG